MCGTFQMVELRKALTECQTKTTSEDSVVFEFVHLYNFYSESV